MPILAKTAPLPASHDVLIVGSGIGGSTLAAGLAGSGARVTILERGEQLADEPRARDTRAIFLEGTYRPLEMWHDQTGAPFNPGNYYYVGGNSKFYGAVLIRYRAEDFDALEHADGVSPAWPFRYDTIEPWYSAAEQLYRVRGQTGEDPTEPRHSAPYPFRPVPDEPAIAEVRERMRAVGLHPFSLPLGVDIEAWLARASTPWDAYPDTRTGKMDAETTALAAALQSPDVTLATGAKVLRLLAGADGRVTGVEVERGGVKETLTAGTVVLAAGAVNTAVILLASGLANRSDQVGRNFMNHNSCAMLAIDPRRRNTSVYQKTLGINDFYFTDGKGGPPLGNVQLLGRVTAPILKANMRLVPEALLGLLSSRAVDWYLMSEDLPDPESRIRLDGGQIVLQWRRTNMTGHTLLIRAMRERLRAAGYPIVLHKPFDRRTPSHQCGTVRIGADPATAPLDPNGRAHDHPNLYVADAAVLPTSAAVNPALTVAALALRLADHLKRERAA
jgi:choline dehydrogenase-like flavoprotein